MSIKPLDPSYDHRPDYDRSYRIINSSNDFVLHNILVQLGRTGQRSWMAMILVYFRNERRLTPSSS